MRNDALLPSRRVPASSLLAGLAAVALGVAGLALAACDDRVAEPDPGPKPKPVAAAPEPGDLATDDLVVGTGDRTVKDSDTIRVHYVGKLLKNGVKFDENKADDQPFEFTVGEGVIEGWSKGVVGMKRGGKRKLTIPSKLGYGETGSPPKIPGGATLVFEVELVGWKGDPEPAATGSGEAPTGPAASASASGVKPSKKSPATKSGGEAGAP
jgi:FKBP-type peptidyl-prolyl cis-trans isomerase FkpA